VGGGFQRGVVAVVEVVGMWGNGRGLGHSRMWCRRVVAAVAGR